jgi:hypothetical protein
MAYQRPIVDILRGCLESMTFPVTVNSVEVVLGTYVLSVCDIYHAQPSYKQTINDVLFKIEDIDADENTITLSTTEEIEEDFWDNITTFNLYTPYFFHGTPIATGETELKQIKVKQDKTPLMWLLEQFKERGTDDELNVIERTVDLRLFFLTHDNQRDWKTDDAHRYAVQPMRRLAENFKRHLKTYKVDCKRVFDADKLEYDFLNYARFGVYIKDRGVEKNLFSDSLAGVEFGVVLPLYRVQDCAVC